MEPSKPALDHLSTTYKTWKKVHDLRTTYPLQAVSVNGQSLDIASVVGVVRHQVEVVIDDSPALRQRLQDSIDTLHLHLQNGCVIYGVNTGFGGSADSRTEQLEELQVSLLQLTQSAIVTSSDKAGQVDRDGQSHVLPWDWVKATILTRANQTVRGHSAVRLEVVETLLALLQHDITPLVPLRGTISASGDLMPLAYIAGSLTGSPDVFVRISSGKVVSSSEALKLSDIPTVTLAPKEGLGLINGTAPSAAAAALILYEAHHLALLAQLLTAFTSECLNGNVEWTAPFIHTIRPHAGQSEAAHNIRLFLDRSTFVSGLSDKKREGSGLWQGRYSTRTSPQWIGPYLEDLVLAHRQIETELNSTCDNPVIDAESNEIFSGGNFQATAITSALDKTRLALQMIGRMLASQCAELINPALNNGLDPNLVFGDPDKSFTMKGIDINMAAYMSELASLAAPVSAHVQSAEMHNQGINSLAFLSARRTREALDVLTHMVAAHAYVCCQAIDLRHYHQRFLDDMWIPLFDQVCGTLAEHDLPEATTADLQRIDDAVDALTEELYCMIEEKWYKENHIGHYERCDAVVSSLVSHLTTLPQAAHVSPEDLASFRRCMLHTMQYWVSDSDKDPDAVTKRRRDINGLGRGASTLHEIVRCHLQVRFHKGLRDTTREGTIGTDVGKIYEAD